MYFNEREKSADMIKSKQKDRAGKETRILIII